jgi:hypothetical protein
MGGGTWGFFYPNLKKFNFSSRRKLNFFQNSPPPNLNFSKLSSQYRRHEGGSCGIRGGITPQAWKNEKFSNVLTGQKS